MASGTRAWRWGQSGKEKVHYEAPPSARVTVEMEGFLEWFADTTPAPGKDDSEYRKGLLVATNTTRTQVWTARRSA